MPDGDNILTINTDGGSRGNPGKSASAFVIRKNEKIIKEASIYLGIKTNNEAEYYAVLHAFKWLNDYYQKSSIYSVNFFIDSQLVVNQLKGEYRIKNINLNNIILLIKHEENILNKKVTYTFVKREKNIEADRLVNLELDKQNINS